MIRRLFGILFALIIALIVIGFLLPTTVEVERSRVVGHSQELVFDVLADLRHFTRWSPWLSRQPGITWRLEGPSRGVGATLVWHETPESPANRLWIVGIERPQRIDLKLEIGGHEADSWFEVLSEGAGSEVRWGMRIEFGAFDLVGRYVGLMLPGLVGSDYRAGLEQFDEYLSGSPGQVPELPEEFAAQ